SGEGFSSPFGGHTGSTAHVPPVYPWIESLLLGMAGAAAAAKLVIVLNILWSSLVVFPVTAIGNKLKRGSGWLFGLAWACMPLLGYSEVTNLWDTSLYTLTLTIVVWASLEAAI